MAFEDYSTKDSVIIAYTGEGKGKTSASLGLIARGLGTGWKVAFVQFIKHWKVGEHDFLDAINEIYGDKLTFHKGGRGFFDAGELSAKGVSEQEHIDAAQKTYQFAYDITTSGDYHLVVCDEINNAVHDGLIEESQLRSLMEDKHTQTNLCLTGRNFPKELIDKVDIATNMDKIKHHFDDKYLANKGVDY